MGATNSVVAGASGGGATAEMPGQMPPVKGGGGGLTDLLPQLEGIMTALKALVEKLGGGAAAAVAGASGDIAAGGPPKDAKSGATNVAGDSGPGQFPTQAPPTKVAGDSGPGQFPTQAPPTKVAGDSGPGGKVTQSDVGGVFQNGLGHQLRRGRGHQRHMAPFQFPGQFTGQFPAPGKVAGDSGPGGKVDQAPATTTPPAKVTPPVTQVAGDSGPGKVEQAPAKVVAPVTQVAGDSGPAKDDAPTKALPTQSTPPVTQVDGASGSEPKAPVVEQASTKPTQTAPAKAPVVGDVQLLELDALNEMQLVATDGSYLFLKGDTASYRTRSGVIRETAIPANGFAVTLSDGTKVSLGMNEKTAWDEQAGTPRDLEILGSDGELFAARTDDGESTSWANTPMTSFNLLEVASMLFDGSYTKFGSGSGEVVQQSGSVAQAAKK